MRFRTPQASNHPARGDTFLAPGSQPWQGLATRGIGAEIAVHPRGVQPYRRHSELLQHPNCKGGLYGGTPPGCTPSGALFPWVGNPAGVAYPGL